MKKFNFLMGIGMGANRTLVGWSNADQPEDWGPGQGKEAGYLALEELDSPIVTAAPLGSYIAVYGEDQMFLVGWISAPFYFGNRGSLNGIGAVGKNAVASDGRRNYGMSRSGAWMTDGSSVQYIDEGIISEHFQREINWNQAGLIQVFRNDVTRCIEFHIPVGVSNVVNEAWSYDPLSGAWSKTKPRRVLQERRVLTHAISGDETGNIELLDYFPDANAGEIDLATRPLFVELANTESGPVGGTHGGAYVDELQTLLRRAVGMECRVGVSEDIDGPVQWADWFPVTTDMSTYQFILPTGVYWQIEFRNPANAAQIDLQGMLLFGATEGVNRGAL